MSVLNGDGAYEIGAVFLSRRLRLRCPWRGAGPLAGGPPKYPWCTEDLPNGLTRPGTRNTPPQKSTVNDPTRLDEAHFLAIGTFGRKPPSMAPGATTSEPTMDAA